MGGREQLQDGDNEETNKEFGRGVGENVKDESLDGRGFFFLLRSLMQPVAEDGETEQVWESCLAEKLRKSGRKFILEA